MKTTVTHITTRLLTFFLALICFATIAQTNTIEKTKQQKQDEQGAALKKWYDSGDIIIDGVIEDAMTVQNSSSNSGDGYTCIKVKISRVLKGKLSLGYINLKIDFAEITNYENVKFIQYMSGVSNVIQLNYRYLIKIKKTDVIQEGYITENKGVYKKDGDAKVINTNEKELYQQLLDYCGVKTDGLEKKSPNQIKTVNNSYKDRIKLFQKTNPSVNRTGTGCSDLFLSEQLDGSSSNNSVEIYNPTASAISLSNYKLLIYHNASLTPTAIPLTGTISAYGTHVVVQQGASSALLARANQTTSNLNFNGDVATALNKGNTHIDIIGEIGVANAAGNWTLTPSGGTNNSDIRRNYSIGQGDTVWSSSKSQWTALSEDSISNLGHHSNICSVDPDLHLSIANGADSSGYFIFDVTGSSIGANTWFDGGTINILYNTSSFGDSIYINGGVYMSNYSAFPSTIYQPSAEDVGSDTLGIYFATNSSLSGPSRTQLTSTPVKMYHVRMKVLHCGINAVVDTTNDFDASFSSYFTNNQTDNWTTGVPYDNTIYNGSFNTPIACTGANITGFSPDSVIAGAWYSGIVSNEAQLTINGSGFGSAAKPTVLMRNAVNNKPPFYIPLDPYDITTWSNTQIVINVPSVRIDGTPIYPGTGLIKVVPNGTTDTAVSSSPVYIPYALLNVTNGVSKRRIGFAYHQVTDSTGGFNADTAAYDFRFDGSTIGNPSVTNANCRPLLKQAIHDWQCGLPIRYRIGKDTTISTTTADGISYINFKPTLSDTSFAAETSVKVLQCTSTITYFANEADISFKTNPGFPWQYVNPTLVPTGSPNPSLSNLGPDFFSVALHELGHATLMLHVNQTNDLMYYKVPASGVGPYITFDDRSGGLDNKNWSKTFNFSTCITTGAITVPSAGAEVCTNPTNGIKEIIGNNLLEISVYPNPAGDYVNVTFVKDSESSNTVKLTNTLGQTVFYRNIGKNEGANEVINLAGLAKGIYILIVTDNQNTVTKKVIVE